MAQGVLPFKYEEENKDSGMTALGGLPVLDIKSKASCNIHGSGNDAEVKVTAK